MTRDPVHHSLFTVDIEDFSARYRNDRARLAVRAAMYRLVHDSFTTAEVDWDSCTYQDCGDGAVIIVPPKVSTVLLLDPLLPGLLAGLVDHNLRAPPAQRIRLRVAVHAGEITRDEHGVTGHDLVVVCRLLDSAELRAALAYADTPLAVGVSDHVYDTIVRHGYRGIEPSTYHPVTVQVKKTRLHGWIHVPGSRVPPSFEAHGGETPPQQLLPDLTAFVGRAMEHRLLDKLSVESRLLVLSGPPGVGKSAIAMQWCHQVVDRYPDGQLYAHLGGPAGSVTVEQVLGHFLRVLGVAAPRVPVGLAEQSALFRSLTAGRRLLLVLDDVESADQVRALLPSSAVSTTVVTSRSRLSGLVANGGRLIEIAPLPEEDGVELLARLVGDGRIEREQPCAQQLAALCAGLPLALCVAGARLVSHPRWSVEKVVAELVDEGRRLAGLSLAGDLSVQVVFDMSSETLSPPAARLYRLLGLHPGPDFEIGLAAAAVAVPTAEAERLVDEIVTANLLADPAADRYRLHDLIRLHARQQALAHEPAEQRELALRRMLDWYLRTATDAGAVVTPHRTDVRRDFADVPVETVTFAGHADALEWLDRERVNLLAAARSAADNGWNTTAWQLADAMWGLFLYRTHYYDWLQFDLLAVRATVEDADREAEAGANDRLGLLFHALGRNDEALAHMATAAQIWRELGDRHRIAGSMERFGFAYLDQGRIELALTHFEQALEGYRELRQQRSVGLALVSIGRALFTAGRPAEAEPPLAEAVGVLDGLDVPDPYNAARARIALARTEIQIGARERALERLRVAAAAMRAVNSPLGQADAEWALGELFEHAGEPRVAKGHYERTEEIYARLGNPGVDQVREHISRL
ncbi:NTPase [Amycolatopsis sp. NBRC 101858]|uniref:ATP-binding protein n=1 Tax=Amycolatopsis sp. NBRC 101858 TaxID=3032200 RepID=UPI0024A48A73|nr:tetratricopeptide repeat protein [Amycolatopsis sp. NBRC 101858]GLY38384.1 NTPase [Amycolatopsis sp. NBRC 101858]